MANNKNLLALFQRNPERNHPCIYPRGGENLGRNDRRL